MLLKFRAVTASWKFEISAAGTCASHLPLPLMKRRSVASTQTTRLLSQQSSADPSVTFFKNSRSPRTTTACPITTPSPGLGPLASPARLSKRVKVEILNTEGPASCGGDDKGLLRLATKAPTGKGKGKAARRPPAQTLSSESAVSPKKPKPIKQALEKPPHAPAYWWETYDAIKEMRSRFPTPVDTMSCNTAKWKEMDPRVRDAYHQLESPTF